MASHPQTLRAWLLLDVAFGLHAYEEAVTGFLPIYNQTASEIRTRIPRLPIPVFSRREWLGRLGMGMACMLALSPEVYWRARWTKPLIRAVSGIMLGNALLHVAGTIRGCTFSTVQFPRPMSGFYSSPLLAAASINMLAALREEQRPKEYRA
ncbi:MAG: hypothetical protein WCD57_12060 [Acidobacteriaceae bacterium]